MTDRFPAEAQPRRRSLARRVMGPRGFIHGREAHHATPTVAALVISCGVLFNGFNSAMGEAIACVVTTMLLAGLLLLQPPSMRLWRRTAGVLLPLAGAIIWVRIASGASLAPDLFAARLVGLFAGAAALMAGLIIGLRPQRVPFVVDQLITFNSLYLLMGLVLRAIDDGGAFDYWNIAWHGRFAGTIGNANVSAAVGGVVAILAVSRLIERSALRRGGLARQREAVASVLYGLATSIGLGVTIAAASRFVFLGLLLALAPMLLWGVTRNRRWVRRHVGLLLAGGAAAIVAAVQFSGLLLERFSTLGPEAAARQIMWSHYYDLALASPWFGYGLGSFQSLNAYYLNDPRLAESLWTVNSPHNLVLQIMLGAGLPYLLLLSFAALMLTLEVVRHIRRGGWGIGEAGIVLAILLMIACGMVDIAMDVPATVVLTLFLAGLLWARALASDEIRVAGAQRPPAEKQGRIAR